MRLEYRLDGVDDGWRAAEIPRLATYTQLRPGAYRFRVRTWNEDGVPSAGEAMLAFRVRPLWYETCWFASIALLGVASLGAGSVLAVQRSR